MRGTYIRTLEIRARCSAAQARPIGSVRISGDRAWVKVSFDRSVGLNGWRKRAHVVWEEANGPIPEGYIIHHDNEDKIDDRLENLWCMEYGDHVRHHNAVRRLIRVAT